MKRRSYRFGVFTVSKKPSDYKTAEGFLRRVYKENEEKIKQALADTSIDPKNYKKQFVRSAIDELKHGNRMIETAEGRVKYKPHSSVGSALRKVGVSEVYKPAVERFRENAMKGIRSEGLGNEFRIKGLRNPATGKFERFDQSKLVYQGKGTYVYDGRIRISYENSPKGKKGGKVTISQLA